MPTVARAEKAGAMLAKLTVPDAWKGRTTTGTATLN